MGIAITRCIANRLNTERERLNPYTSVHHRSPASARSDTPHTAMTTAGLGSHGTTTDDAPVVEHILNQLHPFSLRIKWF